MTEAVVDLVDLVGPHEAQPLPGGDICRAVRVSAGGRTYFAKTPRRPDPHLLPVEAEGLATIAGLVPGLVPQVIAVSAHWLVLDWVEEAAADPGAAAFLGRRLARLHRAPAGRFGQAPEHARIGALAMPAGEFADWPTMYARLRIRPLLDPGLPQCAALADALEERPEWAGPAEPASVLHGDLWAGNVLWSDPPRLVDPACHTGNRETDLAMLALFGAAHLPDLLAAYDAEYPLAPGWQHRVGLHQIWPLLVHHRLFGGAYGQRAERIAAGYLRSG